ncbi:3347_t:CDS:2 [Ambispora gerdemannii]|uniref:3347_t:CDS:1 n=1 Tax=Ambispora gerdemannii TaxID=144530 RepID=A0A9N9B4J4_9GLOM|nr:3347_t:CDS:2 [Ambispora gerdemannii]
MQLQPTTTTAMTTTINEANHYVDPAAFPATAQFSTTYTATYTTQITGTITPTHPPPAHTAITHGAAPVAAPFNAQYTIAKLDIHQTNTTATPNDIKSRELYQEAPANFDPYANATLSVNFDSSCSRTNSNSNSVQRSQRSEKPIVSRPVSGRRDWRSGYKPIDTLIADIRIQYPGQEQHMSWIPFDEFEGHRFVARGGYSSIYQATWLKTGQRIALKSLSDSGDISQDFLDHLKRHWGHYTQSECLRIHGITQLPESGEFMLVMQYVVYGNLLIYLQRNRLAGWKDKVQIVKMIARSMAEIHKRGLIHGDIHPGNIMNLDGQRFVISDLGTTGPSNRVAQLMTKCWEANPRNRPDAQEVLQFIFRWLVNDRVDEVKKGSATRSLNPTNDRVHPEAVYHSRSLEFPNLRLHGRKPVSSVLMPRSNQVYEAITPDDRKSNYLGLPNDIYSEFFHQKMPAEQAQQMAKLAASAPPAVRKQMMSIYITDDEISTITAFWASDAPPMPTDTLVQ